MGTLKQEYLIIPSYENDSVLDDIVKKSEGLFVHIEGWANGEHTYFLAWDGSKEGWTTSNKGDELREEITSYLERSRKHIWYKVTDGDYYDEPVLT